MDKNRAGGPKEGERGRERRIKYVFAGKRYTKKKKKKKKSTKRHTFCYELPSRSQQPLPKPTKYVETTQYIPTMTTTYSHFWSMTDTNHELFSANLSLYVYYGFPYILIDNQGNFRGPGGREGGEGGRRVLKNEAFVF